MAIIDGSSLELIVDIMKIGRVASVIVADQLTPAVLSGSATRLLFGDVFGLDKILPWGVKVYSALAGDYRHGVAEKYDSAPPLPTEVAADEAPKAGVDDVGWETAKFVTP